MMSRSSLAEEDELDLHTVMDHALAVAHGSGYVDLAVFAIDIDRVYWLDPEDERLPFGWEVFLTEHLLLDWSNAQEHRGKALLAALCAPLLVEKPGEPPLGGQIVFAVYDAVVRGALPDELLDLFASWRSAPRELLHALHELREAGPAILEQLAEHCLRAELQPPLAAATRQALEQLRASSAEHAILSVR